MTALRSWFAGAACALFALGCGGDDPPGGGSGGSGGSGASAGMGGQAGGGPVDDTPPTFAGVGTATSVGEEQIALTWEAASDDIAAAAQITYRIYAATTSDGHDFSAPRAIAPAGSLGAVVSGLAPATPYTFVVRAVDTSNNEDSNTTKLTERTKDFTAPTFAGVQEVVGKSKDSIEVSWNPAVDQGTLPSAMVYRVFVADTHDGNNLSGPPTVTTLPGANKVTVSGLNEASPYFVVVRAVDSDGNADSNSKEVSGATLDGTAPTFAGATGASALGTSISLAWSAASDNADPEAYISYRVYQATSPGGQNFATPMHTTAPGATDFTALNLAVSTPYYYVVRAVDSSGNEDTNTVEVSATTAASADITAPVFAGLDTATASSATTIELSWDAASDDFTPAGSIVYDIFTASSPGGQAFTTPTLTTAPGQTQYTLSGLAPLTSVHVVVRARDQAGNSDANVVEKSATTLPDTIPPSFAGLVTVTPQGPTTATLNWNAATDNVSPPGSIFYRVYRGNTPGGVNLATPVATTAAGVTSTGVTGLAPNTTYYFIVRAVDEASNQDGNTIEKSATTLPDTTPPTFGGADDATPQSPTSILLSWSPATDNVTPAAQIVYDVYAASVSGGQNFASPPSATTAGGATSHLMTGLSPGVTYYFVVRARDQAGNRDTNTKQVSAATPVDSSPPTFAGATSVSGASATTLTVNWNPATDNVTPPASIIYRVCMTQSPTGCSGVNFTVTQSVTGGTSRQFTALTPTQTYYFVVRAEDTAGNRDSNSVVVSGATVTDTTPPTFAGLTSATPQGATNINLQWNAASDNVSSPAQIVYDIWRATSSGGQNFAGAPQYTSAAGATSFNADGLNPSTTYYFVARARDQAGNSDSNVVQRSAATTADTTPPTSGIASSTSNATLTSLRINFTQATDNVTPQGNITYRICRSTVSGACNTTFTIWASVVGSPLYHNFTGLVHDQTYYFVVRAEDQFGNRSTNTTQVSGATLADTTPPVWQGGLTLTPSPTVAGRLTATWNAATDNYYAASGIRYRLCWNTTYSNCSSSSFTTMALTGYGTTSHVISGLSNNTLYYVIVRPQDQAGNQNTGNNWGSQTTFVSYGQQIFPTFFRTTNPQGACGACHSFTRANTVNVSAGYNAGLICGGALPYIRPDVPSQSYIFRKMSVLGSTASPFSALCANNYSGVRMPQGGPYSTANINLMRQWIEDGAPNN